MDNYFMNRAISLAKLGLGRVSPNPLVGAVIVLNGVIIGEGYHGFYGDTHAETNAIISCAGSIDGATLYCNLEPCSKSYPGKKNPPCTKLIISSGIKRVVIGQLDPNPNVSGSGVKQLEESGIEVVVNIQNEKCLELNRGYNCIMNMGRPYIHIKWAQSLDGKIATPNGISKWITSEDCRKETHLLRSKYDGIIVGRKTIELDNPYLNTRYGFNPSPRPIIIDPFLKLDPILNVFKFNPIVITSVHSLKSRKIDYNCQFIPLNEHSFLISEILEQLKIVGINSLFVEGGSNLITQFISSNFWDQITVFTAPKLMGSGLSPIGEAGVSHPKDAIKFKYQNIKIIDDHIVFNGYNREPKSCLQV